MSNSKLLRVTIAEARAKLAAAHTEHAMKGVSDRTSIVAKMVEQISRASFEDGFDAAVEMLLDADEPQG